MSEMTGTCGSQYSDEDRRTAIALYAVHGSMQPVSKSMGIPDRTLDDWKKQEWFVAELATVRDQLNDGLISKYQAIADRALSESMDRLEHGDEVFVNGVKERIKVKGKDAATIAAIATDKAQLLQAKPTSIKGDSTSGIRAALEEFAQAALEQREKAVVSDQ